MKDTKILIILDGFGHSTSVEHNAVLQANTPTIDALMSDNPHTFIHTSGEKVGLIDGQMGNSEVGHLNIGAGRVVKQDLLRINDDITSGIFFHNAVLKNQLEYIKTHNKVLHILGLISDGGVHSHNSHIYAMLEMAKQYEIEQVYIHAFTDGRDTPPNSALGYIAELEECIQSIGVGKILTISGRYYAMDRDNRWERIEKAYNAIVHSTSPHEYSSALECIQASYDHGVHDEFIEPSVIGPAHPVHKGDGIICMNFRSDRARQLTTSLSESDFAKFNRGDYQPLQVVTMTEYKKGLDVHVAYPSMKLNNVLGKYLSNIGKTQLRIAETEKYAHVTFFFNGGIEEPFAHEERILIPSPDVATYDLQPEMNAHALTDTLVEKINSGQYDLIVCNYANTDMVGHTGKLDAAIIAVETIDACIARLQHVVTQNNFEMLITADHGNVEKMWDTNRDTPHTAHTSNLVPLMYVGTHNRTFSNITSGALKDLAPTLLAMMNIEQPPEMTGKSLLA